MNNIKGAGDYPPDPGQALRDAVVDRLARTSLLSERITAELSYGSYEIRTLDQLREAQAAQMERFLEAARVQAQARAEEDVEIVPDESVVIGTDPFVSMASLLTAAGEVATEHQTPPAQVFTEDTLYYKARRKASSPNEIAEMYAVTVEQFAMLWDSLLMEAYEKQGRSVFDEVATPTDIDSDPGYQASLQLAVLLQETTRQLAVLDLALTHGPGAFSGLLHDVRQVLVPKRPLVPLVRDLLEQHGIPVEEYVAPDETA